MQMFDATVMFHAAHVLHVQRFHSKRCRARLGAIGQAGPRLETGDKSMTQLNDDSRVEQVRQNPDSFTIFTEAG